MPNRARTGVDASPISAGLTITGLSLVFLSIPFQNFRPLLLIPGAPLLIIGLTLMWEDIVGRTRTQVKLIKTLDLRGDENVLDLGCGQGLMLLGVAKALTTGKVVGLDHWSSLPSYSQQAAQDNVDYRNLQDRVELIEGDVRNLPFSDRQFDVVLCCYALRRTRENSTREGTLQEAMRVLKPGGRLEVIDNFAAAFVPKALQHEGWTPEVKSLKPFHLSVMSWVRTKRPA